MELTLEPDVKQIIEDSVKSGEFASAEEMVSTAIRHLRPSQTNGDFAPGELDRLIAEAEASGPPIPFEQVRAKLKALREQHPASVR